MLRVRTSFTGIVGNLLHSYTNALGYSTFRCYPDLGVLQIGIRAKVIENQQSCLLHHLRLPTIPSTPTPSQGGYFREPMRRYLKETPPVPQDEDEHEPMFIQPHDPDYVLEPIYPEYIPLEDEHEFPVKEQPLPLFDSPTAELLGNVVESDPEEDPEEYEDDETEDGSVDYPMDGGEDGDDDDDNLSGDDANDKDKEDQEEEEEHLAPVDSAVIVPTASISLPPEAEIERPLAMPTLPPSPLTSQLPPSARERLARYEDSESSTARPTKGRGVDYGFVSTLDAEGRRRGSREVGYGIRDIWVDPAKAVPEIAPMTVGEETILIVEEEAYASREAWAHAIGLSQAVHYELQTHREQAELLALREQRRRARQPTPDARVLDYQDASRDADSHI
ncbi:hypothetical protein Tco_0783263 [Tanacetum coccineum]